MEKVQRSVCVNATQSAHTHSQPSIYIYSIRIKGIARSCMFNFWFSIIFREIICPGAKSISGRGWLIYKNVSGIWRHFQKNVSGIWRHFQKNVSGIWWYTVKSVSRRGRGTKKAAAHPPEDIFWNSPYVNNQRLKIRSVYPSLDQRLIICLVHRHLQQMAKSSVLRCCLAISIIAMVLLKPVLYSSMTETPPLRKWISTVPSIGPRKKKDFFFYFF